jgi:chorismate mutase
MEKDLDLQHTLRPELDILANEIIISLKKRARYKQNLPIYEPGLVKGHPDLSLLEYEIARMEQVHAELGRYTYSDQESFTDVNNVSLIILRDAPPSPIYNVPTEMGKKTIGFYIQWIKKACPKGTDSDRFGETVTTDVANLLNLLERITLGKFVAESKFQKETDALVKTNGEYEAIKNLVKHPEREGDVLRMAAQLARHYEFSEKEAEYVFQWLIDATVDVQVRYIQNRLKLAQI